MRRWWLTILAGAFALVAAFFVFYAARLLFVTQGLRAVRPNGRGAYVGAVAFPLLAVLFAWAARMCWRWRHRAPAAAPRT